MSHELRPFIELVKQVVETQLSPALVHNLSVKEDVDADGDPIFRIVVVFEAEKDRLDPDRVVGLARHLRNHLVESEDDWDESVLERFPIFSFMTAEEADAAA
ncbi:MAG: hypothetical protein F4051_06360 [Boseongicola sp. SB0670_bin_30]|nr:hypothetical protein [Boseongicola sp. SB0670_bin_30]